MQLTKFMCSLITCSVVSVFFVLHVLCGIPLERLLSFRFIEIATFVIMTGCVIEALSKKLEAIK